VKDSAPHTLVEREAPPGLVAEERPRGVTLRAVLLGLAFVAALAFLIPYLSEVKNGPDLGLGPVTGASILALLVVLGPINGLLLWLRRRWALSRQEVLTVYAMVAGTAAISTAGFGSFFTVMVTASQYFATPENRWDVYIQPYFPTWLQIGDLRIRMLWEGLRPGDVIPWAAWRSPALAWSAIALCIYVGSFSLMSLVRRDWIESQRLAFPLRRFRWRWWASAASRAARSSGSASSGWGSGLRLCTGYWACSTASTPPSPTALCSGPSAALSTAM
jgi:hypothetical protein